MAMAKAICTCKTCGKKFEVSREVFKASERDNTIAYMQEHYTECTECYKARMRAKVNETATYNGWAPLTGSDKQIDWATSIRDKMIAYAMGKVKPEAADFAKAIIIKITAKHTDARWWIDHRDDNRALLQEMADAANNK